MSLPVYPCCLGVSVSCVAVLRSYRARAYLPPCVVSAFALRHPLGLSLVFPPPPSTSFACSPSLRALYLKEQLPNGEVKSHMKVVMAKTVMVDEASLLLQGGEWNVCESPWKR